MTESSNTPSAATGISARPVVVVFDPIPGEWEFEPEREILAARGIETVMAKSSADGDRRITGADVVVVTGVRRLEAAHVASLKNAVGILCYSVGMDSVDARAAEAGIVVRNVPDYCTEEVADHAMALLLATERRLMLVASRSGHAWADGKQHAAGIRRLRGQVLGIVGAGRVGRLVAARARTFGFNVIAADPHVERIGNGELEMVSLATLMERSDAVIVCAALTPESHGLLGSDAFAVAKRGLILVNVARGPLIDEAALAEALATGVVGYAALDVRAPEPPDPSTDELSSFDQVLQTPHVAGASIEAVEDLHLLAAKYILELLEAAGRIPKPA